MVGFFFIFSGSSYGYDSCFFFAEGEDRHPEVTSGQSDESISDLGGKACDKLKPLGIEPEGYRGSKIDTMLDAVGFAFDRVILIFHSGIIPMPPE
jgi:hypothetical protein